MKRLRLLVNKPYLTVALLLLYQTPLMAQEGQSTESADTDRAPPAAVSLSDLLDMLNKQQSQLDDQKQQLAEQQILIAMLQGQATIELAA